MTAFDKAWSFLKENSPDDENYGDICDGCGGGGKIGRLAWGGEGGGGSLLCRKCWKAEMDWRHDRNNETTEEREKLARHGFEDLFNDPAVGDIVSGVDGIIRKPAEPLFDIVAWPYDIDELDIDREALR